MGLWFRLLGFWVVAGMAGSLRSNWGEGPQTPAGEGIAVRPPTPPSQKDFLLGGFWVVDGRLLIAVLYWGD
jgi:hypothetical protein